MKTKMLHLALLGSFDMRVAGNPLDIGYAKLRALLAFLAMSPGVPVQREYLAELFWPGMPAAAGRQNLRRALFNLKSAMGCASKLLFAKRDVVMLTCTGSLWLDVAEFTAVAPSCMVAPTPAYCSTASRKWSTWWGFIAANSWPDFHCRTARISKTGSNCNASRCIAASLPYWNG
jgi:DNA-binding SARP family transcriptional activator